MSDFCRTTSFKMRGCKKIVKRFIIIRVEVSLNSRRAKSFVQIVREFNTKKCRSDICLDKISRIFDGRAGVLSKQYEMYANLGKHCQ